MGSGVRPGSSGALRRRSSGGGGKQGGIGGPSFSSLEPGVEQGMPSGMQTSIERRKVNGILGTGSEPTCFGSEMFELIQKRNSNRILEK